MLTCLSCGAEWEKEYEICPLDGSPLLPELGDLTQIGPYTLLSSLGGGGMARVYQARTPNGEEVALKVLFRRVETNNSATSRFDREAEILQGLAHPHVVKIFEAGKTEEGTRYLAMELLRGEDLSARLKRVGPLSLEEAFLLAKQITSALKTIHKAGIVHRDLKPSNLWLQEGEFVHAKLIDFGIARPLDATNRLTAAGKIIGTPAYLAPEQLRGDDLLDSRADIYSFAVTLYEALSGRLPIEAPDAISLMVRVASEEPTPLHVYRPDIPISISNALLQALAKEPEQRFSSTEEFDQALREAFSSVVNTKQSPQEFLETTNTLQGSPELFDSFSPDLSREKKEIKRVTVVLVERVGTQAPKDFIGRAVEALRAAGASAEPLKGGRVAAVFSSLQTDAQEANQAVSCALALRHPAVRIGISTDSLSVAAGYDFGEAGASQLSKLANTGEIRIDQETLSQVKDWIEFDKQSDGSYRVTGILTRSQSRQVIGIETPTVGRQTEMTRLRVAIGGVTREKHSRAIVFWGEDGGGKSRVLEDACALAETLVANVILFKAEAQFFQQNEVLSLLQNLLPEKTRDRLIPTAIPTRKTPRPLDGGQRHSFAMLEKEILSYFQSLCKESFLLFALENLHYADQVSLQILSNLLLSKMGPALILATADKTIKTQTSSFLQQATQIEIPPLEQEQVVSLLQTILNAPPPDTFAKNAYEVSQGNPLILEELIRHLVDTEHLQKKETGRWQIKEEFPEISSDTLIKARLKTLLPNEKELLKRASIFAKPFARAMLPNLGIVKPSPLLKSLQKKEFLQSEVGKSQTLHYRFRSRAIKKTLYRSLSPKDQKALHRGAGQWQKAKVVRDPALLAWHAEKGERPQKALRYLKELSRSALLRGCSQHALSYLQHALSFQLDPLERFELIVDREEILYTEEHWQESWQEITTLFEILETTSDPEKRCLALLREARALLSSDLERARESVEEAMQLTEQDVESLYLAEGKTLLGILSYYQGEFATSQTLLKEALFLAKKQNRTFCVLRILQQCSMLFSESGDYIRALQSAKEGLLVARKTGMVFQEIFLLMLASDHAKMLGCFEEAKEYLQIAIPLSEDQKRIQGTSILQAKLSTILLCLGQIEDSCKVVEKLLANKFSFSEETLCTIKLSAAQALWTRQTPGDSSLGIRYIEAAIEHYPGSQQELEGRIYLARWLLEKNDLPRAMYNLEQAEKLKQQHNMLSQQEEKLSYAWYLAFLASGQTEEAKHAIDAAATTIKNRAALIQNPEKKNIYLSRVLICQEIIAAWESIYHQKFS